jgi:beta-aspartyl-peptidase (threonine type)
MLLVGSGNAAVGMDTGWSVLADGGSALDAVEAAVRPVEDNPDDHTVGYSGYPNLLGEVELDASIMDGTTRRAGAVGALSGYRHAVTVARAVMERTPHVLVAGPGAARLAGELGLEHETLLTPEIEEIWRRGVEGKVGREDFGGEMLSRVAHLVQDPDRVAGTVNVIAVDARGRIAAAVSTSGWAWKYPGRLGDSCVVGAGNYADDRFGAATCTGWGELAIRAGAARAVVDLLARGTALPDACVEVVEDMASLDPGFRDIHLHLIAVDAKGGHCAVSTRPDAAYVVRTEEMDAAEQRPRVLVGGAR